MSEGRCTLDTARRLALAGVELRHGGSERTRAKAATEISRFFKFVDVAFGIEYLDELTTEVVYEFLWAATPRHGVNRRVSPSTARNRRWAVRACLEDLEHLGVWDGRDVTGPAIRSHHAEGSRILTVDELDQIRVQASGAMIATRDPLMFALSEAGGSAGDIAEVTFDDIDLDGGTVSFTGARPRINPLSEWGIDAIRAWVHHVDSIPNGRLCTADRLSQNNAAHSVTVGLRRLIKDAGLGSVLQVTASSIRLTFAKSILDESGIVEAARFLGHDSLDSTATALGFDWRCA